MKKAIVLDWDGVIFSDDSYKSSLFEALSEFTDIDTVDNLYQSSKDKNGYNDRQLARAIANTTNTSLEIVQSRTDDVLNRTADEFIFEDAKQFVMNADNDTAIIVLTAGDERIQLNKLFHSGLSDYFERVIVVSAEHTEGAKERAIRKLLIEFESILFFDDRASTIEHLREIYRDDARVKPVFVLRDNDAVVNDAYTTNTLSHDWIRARASD